ncbi:MAG: FxsA family protein [Paracoccaceae bacterium]
MWLFVLFLAVPLIEIALFIQVGGFIGLWWTLGIVIFTAYLGTRLIRSQGAMAMKDLQSSFNELRDPTEPLAHGAMILFSGALLLTPGFFTDAVGFALLVPGIRRVVYAYVRSRIKVQGFSGGGRPVPARDPSDSVIDGEFTEIDPESKPAQPGDSGWTKH